MCARVLLLDFNEREFFLPGLLSSSKTYNSLSTTPKRGDQRKGYHWAVPGHLEGGPRRTTAAPAVYPLFSCCNATTLCSASNADDPPHPGLPPGYMQKQRVEQQVQRYASSQGQPNLAYGLPQDRFQSRTVRLRCYALSGVEHVHRASTIYKSTIVSLGAPAPHRKLSSTKTTHTTSPKVSLRFITRLHLTVNMEALPTDQQPLEADRTKGHRRRPSRRPHTSKNAVPTYPNVPLHLRNYHRL